MINYILQFIIGGGTIVGMSFLAKNFDPKYAAFLYALPIQYTIALIFIHINSEKKGISELIKHNLSYSFIFITFLLMLFFLLKHFNFWPSLIISYFFFAIFMITVVNF